MIDELSAHVPAAGYDEDCVSEIGNRRAGNTVRVSLGDGWSDVSVVCITAVGEHAARLWRVRAA